MHMLLERLQLDPDVTIGSLSVDGDFRCWTCEDPVRGDGDPAAVNAWKVPGKSAIPYGLYAVQITPSQRFQRLMPLLIAVPGFTGVRIHPGNTAADTEGCILVGRDRYSKSIGHSILAYAPLFAELQYALQRGGVTLEIVGP